MDEDEAGPTEVNTTKASHLVKVHKDKLTVTYNGKANHPQDVGAVQSNRPFSNKVLIGYFEMTVVNAGAKGNMAIGLGNSMFNNTRQPGLEPGSYGYFADDGRKCSISSRGEPYGAKYGAGDVVGCGLHFGTREIFFTKNGKNLGVAFTDPGHSYYPTVGLHSEGEIVKLNFGDLPFVFPLEEMLREEREKLQATILRVPLPAADVNSLVRLYLWHEGHIAALRSFEAAANLQPLSTGQGVDQAEAGRPQDPMLVARSAIRGLIMEGEIERAVSVVEQHFPSLLSRHRKAEAYLQCQHFVELLRQGSRMDAVHHARRVLARLMTTTEAAAPKPAHNGAGHGPGGGSRPQGGVVDMEDVEEGGRGAAAANARTMADSNGAEEMRVEMVNGFSTREAEDGEEAATVEYVQSVIGLLAYQDPSDSPLAALLATEHRKVVADVVNAAVHAYRGSEQSSALQRLMQQLLASHDTLRQLQGGRGEVLDLVDFISRT